MTGELVHCMGGWCTHRHHCAHHFSQSKVISERLCPKGDPQPVEYMPIVRDEHLPSALRDGALERF